MYIFHITITVLSPISAPCACEVVKLLVVHMSRAGPELSNGRFGLKIGLFSAELWPFM